MMCSVELEEDIKPFVNGTSEREAYPKQWRAVLVPVCLEKKVGLRLKEIGIENYVPTQTEIHQWSDRKKKIERIVIPMIVFVYIDKETVNTLRTYSFIHKFISYPGQKEPAIIPNEQIERLRYMLNHTDSKVEILDSAFEIGKKVEIVRGPLRGLSGILCYVEKDRPMLGVYVELLGYACVSVNKIDVKEK